MNKKANQIDIILPVHNPRILSDQAISNLSLPQEIQCKIKMPNNNYREITSAEDEKAVTPSIVDAIVESEKQSADAVIVYCFGEPGVVEARSKVSMPVFGIASPAMHIAAQLGNYFSVIASVEAHCPLIDQLASRFGLSKKMKKPRSIDISPDKLVDSDDLLYERSLEVIRQSVIEDHVDTFVLGCGSMQSKGHIIQRKVKDKFGLDVVIVDPLPVSIYFVNAILASKLTHNKSAFNG